MKLHTPKPVKTVRLIIRKSQQKYHYIMLEHQPIEVIEEELKNVIIDTIPSADIFYKGHRLGIDIREYEGKRAGRTKTISFKSDVTTQQVKEILLSYIERKSNKNS